MYPDQIARLFDNNPGGWVRYRENPGISVDFVFPDISPESVCDFLGQEHNLRLLSTFGVPDGSFPVFDILRPEFQECIFFHIQPLKIQKMIETSGNFYVAHPFC
jgi:hypothetical protein